MADILARQRQIVGSTLDWSAHDLVLGDGEIAIERIGSGVAAKVGNGALPFSAAPYIGGVIEGPFRYKGEANPTLPPPAGAVSGDAYSANPGGVVAASWGPPAAGTTVTLGDLLVMDDLGRWNVLPGTGDDASDIAITGGGTVQNAVMVADNPRALIASSIPLAEGTTIRTANGFIYKVAPAAAVDHHVTTAGGAKLYSRDRHITPDALGAPLDGVGDDAPYVERAFQIKTAVHLVSTSRYRLASIIGLPDRNLYVDSGLFLFCNGAKITCHSPLTGAVPEGIFTSAAAKLDPESTTNLFSGKIFIGGGSWWQDAASVIFNGDRLYQLSLFDNSFDDIDTVIKSFRSKGGGLTQGYIQSLQMRGNQFSNVRRIVDAKRAFDVEFSGNKCSSCLGGIYIDSDTADPAVNDLYWTDNLFQGGGLALVLGKVLALIVKGGYMEANDQGDAATAKCNIWLKAGPSASSGVLITGVGFQPTTAQRADAAYVEVRIDFVPSGSAPFPHIMQCFTTGPNIATPGRFEALGIGSNSPLILRNAMVPLPATTARRGLISTPVTYLATTNLSAGVFRVAAFDVQFLKSMLPVDSARAVKGELSIMMQHRTAGGIVNGTSHAVFGFLFTGAAEGISSGRVDDVFAMFALKDFMQIAAGQVMETTFGATTRAHFTAPAFTFDRTGDVFNLRLSGYAAPSNPNYGAADRITSQITLEMDCQNNSQQRAVPLVIGP